MLLPLSMGGPAGPTVIIDRIDGSWCVCTLGIDEAAWQAFADERHRTGQPLFPEHRMQFLRSDQFLLRCPSREALLERFAAVELVLDEGYRPSLRPRAAPIDTVPAGRVGGWLRRLLGRGD